MDPLAGRPARRRRRIVAAVAAGGVIGTLARYGVATALPSHPGYFPLATFVINVSGSVALGVLVTLIIERWPPNQYLRPFVATGMLGAYTTWSTFMVDAANLFRSGHPGVAIGYLAASLAGGLGGAYGGILLTRAGLVRLRNTRAEEA
jgi:CrcB protein